MHTEGAQLRPNEYSAQVSSASSPGAPSSQLRGPDQASLCCRLLLEQLSPQSMSRAKAEGQTTASWPDGAEPTLMNPQGCCPAPLNLSAV